MTYLICERCGGYYQLKEGEKVEDFSDECECGGKLFYTESLPENREGEIYQDDPTEDTFYTDEYSQQDQVEVEPPINNQIDGVGPQTDYQIEDIEPQADNQTEDMEPPENIQIEDINESITLSEQDKKRKEYKYALELQEILDLRGSYVIKEGVGGQSFKVVPEGIETHNGLFIKFTDIISVEDVSKPRTVEKKSGIAGLISSGQSLLSSTRRTLKLRYLEGEIEFKDVKKNDAKRLVSYINRLISKE